MEILFEADQRSLDPLVTLDARRSRAEHPLNAYTSELVSGVVRHAGRIDELLSTYAVGWTLDRMPAVDRSILRLGTYELIWEDETPDQVAVSEAVDAARELSTDESPNFVNGLLGRLMKVKPTVAR